MDATELAKLEQKLAKMKAKLDDTIEQEEHERLARQYNKMHRQYQSAKAKLYAPY